MFARISYIDGLPDKIEAGIKGFEERVLPEVEQQQGFKEALFLVDRKSGKVIAITLWDTEADLLASEAMANRLRKEGAAEHGAPAPRKEIYEVASRTWHEAESPAVTFYPDPQLAPAIVDGQDTDQA